MGASNVIKAVFKPSSYQRGIDYYSQNGLKMTLLKLHSKLTGNDSIYDYWWRNHKPTKDDLIKQRNHKLDYCPKFSIVVPLYKTPIKFLKILIDSIVNQSYENWELVLSDGSGKDSPLKSYLENVQTNDHRIKVVSSEQPLQISENTNCALRNATGDFIVFADHDDKLALNALYEFANVINSKPEVEFIYSDEDKIGVKRGKHFAPNFKSDFNYDMLTTNNYICHLVGVKKDLLDDVGFLNSEFDGAQDFDFVLRCIEKKPNVYHITKILYHWRAHKESTALSRDSKNYADDAGRRAIQAYYDRQNISAKAQATFIPGIYRTFYSLHDKPLVSIVIPNKDHIVDLMNCIQSIEYCNSYENYEIIIVENNSEENTTFDFYKSLENNDKIKVVYWEGTGFNYPSINNFGASCCSGDYLLFLNNDTEFIEPDSIREMLSYCQRDDVGAVGAKLFYPDGTVQHAGVILAAGGVAGHSFLGCEYAYPGYFARAITVQDLSIVTAACMLVKTSIFNCVGGFDEKLAVAFNDVDLCMKIRKIDKLVVYTPHAKLWHYESKSRGYEDTPEKKKRFIAEVEWFQDKWKDELNAGDEYYNPNLSIDNASFNIRI